MIQKMKQTQKILGVFVGKSLAKSQFAGVAARALGKLFCQRRYAACRFVTAQSFDAPEREKYVGETEKRFVVDDGPHPIVKGVQINAAQAYTRRVDFVQQAPTFFAWAVQHQNDRRAVSETWLTYHDG